MKLLLLVLLLPDVSPKTGPRLRVEELGTQWTARENFVYKGLAVQRFTNNTRKRDEVWHMDGEGRWWIRVRTDTFVLASQRPDKVWVTHPRSRKIHYKGAWRTLFSRKQPEFFPAAEYALIIQC